LTVALCILRLGLNRNLCLNLILYLNLKAFALELILNPIKTGTSGRKGSYTFVVGRPSP